MSFDVIQQPAWFPESVAELSTIHHPWPVSRGGGKSDPENRWQRPNRDHNAWHVLMGNMCASDAREMCHTLQGCYQLHGGNNRFSFGFSSSLTPLDSRILKPKPLPVVFTLWSKQLDAYRYLFQEDILDIGHICDRVRLYADPKCTIVPIVI